MYILNKLTKIDSRIIYMLLSIVVLIPLLIKLPTQIEPDSYSQIVYNELSEILRVDNRLDNSNKNIDKSHKSRSKDFYYNTPNNSASTVSGTKKILLSFDYGPSTVPEVGPMSYAIMRQVLESGNEVHTMALWDTGLPMIAETKKNVLRDMGLDEKDVKIHDFGFKSGGESVIKGMLANIPKTFPKAEGIIEKLCDYDFIVSFSAGSPGSKEWVQFAGDQSSGECGKKVKVSTGVTAVQVTELLPYVSDREDAQLTGILAGLSGAASYETLVNLEGEFSGKAAQRMNSQSWAHILIIFFIVVGNIAYFILNKRKS